MDNKQSNGVMPDSLKRKRDMPTEDVTPDLERGGSLKKIDNAKNNDLNSTKTATTDITDPDDADIIYISSDTEITSDDQNNTSAEIPSKPSLQTLPRELRNLIYEYLAATEDRIVLGRRMVEAVKSDSTEDLDDCFEQATALHPLSMTCHQFRDEFQEVHTEATEPLWILLVNNFDLEQLRIFSEYIAMDESIIASNVYDEEFDPCNFPDYEPDISLRFQMDDRALMSATNFCHNVYFDCKGAAPESLTDYAAEYKILSVAEIVTEYVPRTTTGKKKERSLKLEEAQRIETMLRALRGKVEGMPRYEWEGIRGPFGRKLGRVPNSFAYMEQCWFEPFYKAFNLWRDKVIQRNFILLDRAYSRYMEEKYDEENDEEYYEKNNEQDQGNDHEDDPEDDQEEDGWYPRLIIGDTTPAAR